MPRVPDGGADRPRCPPRLTAQQRAALKLQGKYMGTMRGLPTRRAAQVKRIRPENGIRAAIKEAVKLAGWSLRR